MSKGKRVMVGLVAAVVLVGAYAVGVEEILQAALALVALAAFFVALGAPWAGEVVRARRIELVDAERRVRAALTLGPDGTPTVSRFAEDGELRAIVALRENGSQGILLRDRDGQMRVMVGLDEQGRVIWKTMGGSESC